MSLERSAFSRPERRSRWPGACIPLPEEHGRIFRNAWIAGIKAHYPGEPRPGYIAPWEGRFVSLCWIAQIYKYFPEPKPSYVADWSEEPEWQQETNADIFEAIEALR